MNTDSCHNEKQLLQRISEGDGNAFNDMVGQYTPVLYGTALAYLKIAASAEDVVQEVFYKAWKNRAKMAGVDSLKDYLFIMTRNEVISGLRKKGPHYPVSTYLENALEEEDMQPGHILALRQMQQALQRAVTLLPPKQKQAYLLSREEGLPHSEIAQKMNLSPNTVKNHIIAALNFIRRYMQDNGDIVFLLLLTIHATRQVFATS